MHCIMLCTRFACNQVASMSLLFYLVVSDEGSINSHIFMLSSVDSVDACPCANLPFFPLFTQFNSWYPPFTLLINFKNTLARAGFSLIQHQGFLEASGCINVTMLGLLLPEQVNCILKRLATMVPDPVPTSAIQE
jgi:hypothetical protein